MNYEGVECIPSEISEVKEKSGTQELESITKDIRPEDVEGIMLRG